LGTIAKLTKGQVVAITRAIFPDDFNRCRVKFDHARVVALVLRNNFPQTTISRVAAVVDEEDIALTGQPLWDHVGMVGTDDRPQGGLRIAL
jgi:hypothetical protein